MVGIDQLVHLLVGIDQFLYLLGVLCMVAVISSCKFSSDSSSASLNLMVGLKDCASKLPLELKILSVTFCIGEVSFCV